MHHIFVDVIPGEGAACRIEGDEAHHALRVKRLGAGQSVALLDGAGARAAATVVALAPGKRAALEVRIDAVEHIPPERPAVCVLAPAPKGGGLEQMIDQLSQVGAAAWAPLRTGRSEREPRSLERLRRVAIEAAKQCGRAHLLAIEAPTDLEAALARPGVLVVADAAGARPARIDADEITILIGPEGGWSDAERGRIAASDARVLRFAPHVMRIETAAAVAASAMLL